MSGRDRVNPSDVTPSCSILEVTTHTWCISSLRCLIFLDADLAMEILFPSNQSIFYKATKRTLPNPEQAKALSSLQTSVWLLGALRIKSKLLHTTSIQGTSSPGLSSLSGLTFSLSLPSTYPMLFFNLILSSLTANNLHALFLSFFFISFLILVWKWYT